MLGRSPGRRVRSADHHQNRFQTETVLIGQNIAIMQAKRRCNAQRHGPQSGPYFLRCYRFLPDSVQWRSLVTFTSPSKSSRSASIFSTSSSLRAA